MAHVQEVLAGRYELLDVLGRGGMGVVYRATDRRLDRVVAVKVLPIDSAEDPTAIARFEREALAAASLTHRNIVSVFDSGRDDATRFIVMEYVGGPNLARLIHEEGQLDVEQTVAIGAQIASALGAAHIAGIVHRDIKPGNLMLDEHGIVKVLDFGIVRLAGGLSLTRTATVLGSAAYLAPELSRGARADARSDIYALGCVLYEMLTGHPPFIGELPATILSQHISSTPRPPEELNPAVPSALNALVIKMLAKRPDARPQDAVVLAGELPAALRGPGPVPLRAGPAPTVPLIMPPDATTAPTVAMRPRVGAIAWSRRRVAAVAAAAALVVAAALIGLAGSSGTGRHAARASTHRGTATGTARRVTTTGALKSVLPIPPPAHPQPHPGHDHGPPGHHPGGPHGLPPGQAKKLGKDAQNQNQQ